MRLLVISGFLGSGKTTLLSQLAPRLGGGDPRKVVVLENEVGSPGVDDQILAGRGLQVREVYGGCICCTLRHNLRQTLYEIAETFAPEVILVEPSGVADPGDVVATAVETGLPFARIDLVTLIDAQRFERIRLVCGPFLERSIARADIAVINKADTIDAAALEALTGELRAIRPDGPLLAVAAREGVGLEALWELLASEPAGRSTGDAAPGQGVTPLTVARRQPLSFVRPRAGSDVIARVVELHRYLAGVLQQSGLPVAGHIKSHVAAPDGQVALVQTTALEAAPLVTGELGGELPAAVLTINAVLVGAGLATVTALVETELARLAAGL